MPSLTTYRAALAAALVTAAVTALATPVAVGEMLATPGAVSEMPPTEPPANATVIGDAAQEVDQWVHGAATQHLLSHGFDDGRSIIVRAEWEARPPSWIQSSALASEASQAQSERAIERAEQELQTLQWVLEEQRRQAEAANRPRRDDDPHAAVSDDRWFRRLLPQQLIAHLKANREWVAAGGTTLLLVVWGASVFARRPTSALELQLPRREDAKPRKQHRHRRRHRTPLLQ